MLPDNAYRPHRHAGDTPSYDGFEIFYENLGPGLAARGHDVSVYIRPHAVGAFDGRDYRGVRLIALPSIKTKHLETITHTLLSVLHGLTRRYDIVFVCGVGNTPLVWIPRLRRARVVLEYEQLFVELLGRPGESRHSSGQE